MLRSTQRALALILAGTLSLSMLSFAGCKSTGTKEKADPDKETTEITEEDTEPDESVDEEPEATSESEEDPDANSDPADPTDPSTKVQAVALAENAGLTEDDILGKYDLFLKYAEAIDANPGLCGFRGYVYHLFPIVAEHLKPEDEDYFFNKLCTLSIDVVTDDDAAGGYSIVANSIAISMDVYTDFEDELIMTVYHELMHFLDASIGGDEPRAFYVNGKIKLETEMTDADWNNNPKLLFSNMVSEGGAEVYMAKNFSHTLSTICYIDTAEYFTTLEYILGEDVIDDIFFSNNSSYHLAQVLSEHGFSDEEIYRLFNATNQTVFGGTYSTSDLYSPEEALIRLYEDCIGPDYEDDAIFFYLLGACTDQNHINLLGDYSDFVRQAAAYHQDLISHSRSFEGDAMYIAGIQDQDFGFFVFPCPLIFEDGKPYLENRFFVHDHVHGGGHYEVMRMDYDFDAEVLEACDVFVPTLPVDPTIKLDTETSQDAKDLIASKIRENPAHVQYGRVGSNNDLSDLYDHAMEIGSRYGVYIYFADLIPETLLPNESSYTPDHDTLAKALDELEAVLALYPEDYFDQLLYGYYSGVNIYLYEGVYTSTPTQVYEDGNYYMSIFANLNLTEVPKYYGAENLRSTYYSDISPLSAWLIVEIWNSTQTFFNNYSENFTDPFICDETWKDSNPPYTYYADSTMDELIKYYVDDKKSMYFLMFESWSSVQIDQLLLYEYIMLGALQISTTGSTSAPKITHEIKGKVELLFDFINHAFDTSNWPDPTSWEEGLSALKGG